MKNRVVELFGVPGSGKTTLLKMLPHDQRAVSRRLTVNLRKRDKALKLIYKGVVVVKVILHSPRVSLKQFRLIRQTKQKTTRDLLKVAADWFYTLYLLQKARGGEQTVIFDQGMIQAVWSIQLRAAEKLDLEALLREVTLPDVVVVLEVEESVIRQRLYQRTGRQSRLERNGLLAHGKGEVKPFQIFQDMRQYLAAAQTEMIMLQNNDQGQLRAALARMKIIAVQDSMDEITTPPAF